MVGKVDIKLDLVTHDILIEDSDMQLVKDINWLRQAVKVKFLFFLGEWFLDTTIGLDHYGLVYVKDPDLNLIDNMFKFALIEFEEIIEILFYESTLDPFTRQLDVNFTASTVFGEEEFSVTI